MIRFIKLLIWIFVIIFIVQYNKYSNFKEFTTRSDITVNIESGETPTSFFVNELGLNKLYLKISDIPERVTNLQVGKYTIPSGSNFDEIINILNSGTKTEQFSITILPGWNIYDIDEYLSENNILESNEYIKEATNVSKYSKDYSFLSNRYSMEGYLYPDTYFINKANYTAETIIKRQLETFNSKVYEPLLKKYGSDKIDQLIKFASIVEKEEQNTSEQSTVAGILIKRFQEGWMIGADITACYPYKYTQEECRLNLSKHITAKNDYNTRTMVGLPRTAIGNPSYTTIYNTLNYKVTKYYYYLHNSVTGKIYYGVTNADHEYNKRYLSN